MTFFSIEKAISSIQSAKSRKFDESIDVAVRLFSGSEVKKSEFRLKHSCGDEKILIFCSDTTKFPVECGKRFLCGAEDLVDKIKTKKSIVSGYKYSVASPDLIPKIGRIAKILGPRGLMPDQKFGFVTHDIASVIDAIDSGKSIFKQDKNGILHVRIGRLSFASEKLVDNFRSFVDAVLQFKSGNASISSFIKSIAISSTMGDGHFVDLETL